MRPSTEETTVQAQRKVELLIAKVLIATGLTTSIIGLWDSGSGLTTTWDNYGIPITSFLYFISGLIMYRKSEWILGAVLLTLIPTSIYQVGVLFWSIHYPDPASYYSAASAGPFFPLIYIVLFITLPKEATRLSWLHCSGFYLQFLLNNTVLADPSASDGRIAGEHLLQAVMFSHPVYILALQYIVQLRERLFETQREAFENKAGFLAMLSHEIRNLLQTMVSTIDMLDLRLKEPAERKSVARLQTAAMQLQTYLSDIGELTKLENPALSVQTESTDIPELLRDIREEWLPKAEARGLKLDVLIDPAIAPGFEIATDKGRLRQIMVNLVSNALKYTVEGGVAIHARPSTGEMSGISLEVADTGVGIEARFLEKIFEPYIRLENPMIGRSEGSGLGLTIVARLVASIGGKIRVDSQPGQGTRFRVDLPGKLG